MVYFTFSFDDSYRSFLDAAKILSEYGYHGTFNISLRGVVISRVPKREKMFPPENILTWDEVKRIQAMGHEIAAHGIRHIDLHNCTTEELQLEIIAPKRIFASYGIEVNSYACQFNEYSPKMFAIGCQYYDKIRGVANMDNSPPYNVPVYHTYGCDDALKRVMKATGNIWVCGAWHDIAPTNFRSMVDKIKEMNVQVKSVGEMSKCS